MRLIRLGAAYINMDLVTDIWISQGRVTLFFAAPVMYNPVPFQGVSNAVSTREIQFAGPEADALIRWLDKKAKHIAPEVETVLEDPTADESSEDRDLAEIDVVDDSPSS